MAIKDLMFHDLDTNTSLHVVVPSDEGFVVGFEIFQDDDNIGYDLSLDETLRLVQNLIFRVRRHLEAEDSRDFED